MTPHSSRGSLRNALDAPARTGSRAPDGSRARASAERGPPSSMAISPNRSPGSIRATTVSRWSIGLAMAMAMRPRRTTYSDVGDVAFVEQHVAADRGAARARRRRSTPAPRCGASAKNSVLGEEVFVSHVRRTVLPSPGRAARARASCGPSWSPAAPGSRFGGAKQFELLGARRVLDLRRATSPESASDGVVVVVPASGRRSRGRRGRRRDAERLGARRARRRAGRGRRSSACTTRPARSPARRCSTR